MPAGLWPASPSWCRSGWPRADHSSGHARAAIRIIRKRVTAPPELASLPFGGNVDDPQAHQPWWCRRTRTRSIGRADHGPTLRLFLLPPTCRERGDRAAGRRTPHKTSRGTRLYTWRTHPAQDYFCGVCGIYTHHKRRSNPNEFGVNVGALDGVNPAELGEIEWTDGVNHPSDR